MQQLGAVALGVQRVHRHVLPAQVQQSQQIGKSGDLVGLAIHGDLAEAKANVGCECVQKVQGRTAVPGARAAPHGLAVDGDVARSARGARGARQDDTPGEVGQHRLELLRADEPEQPPKRVMGWRAVPIRQVAAQEADLGPGELRLAVATPKPAQRGAQRRKQNLGQAVGGPADNPRIIDPGKQLASRWCRGVRV